MKEDSRWKYAAAMGIAGCIAFPAFALSPVCPVLPPVVHIDTETVTNMPFIGWQEHAGKFKFSLTCRTTATNNVQFAFGHDADDDGVLDN